jgi:hypothetical protein
MASGRLIDYLGHGNIADRPVTPTLTTDAIGVWWSDDTSELSVWDGSAWQEDVGGGGSSPLADGDYGDITVSGSGTAMAIDSGAVTYAKIQDVSAASTLLGRGDSGSGDVEEIILGTGLTMTGTTLSAAAGSGGLTYVGSATVAGAAASTLTISGLDLNSHKGYFIRIKLKNAVGSVPQVSLYFNADTTASNYDSQVYGIAVSALSGGRANSARLVDIPASSYAMGTFELTNDLQNKPTAVYTGMDGITTAILLIGTAVAWRTTGTNVTGITLSASVANALDIGSSIEVWARD